jgi:copper homeostasis protein
VTSVTLEIAVTTPDEAAAAVAAGANRLELCAALEVGGLTPSPGVFIAVREAVDVPVWVLLRPRPGGFAYSGGEMRAVLRDTEWFRANGADGVVFGALTADGRIHEEHCRAVVERSGGACAFHRVFDFLPDPAATLERVIGLGFERVLTSGGAASAIEGAAVIAALVREAAGRIGVLPGGGVRPGNVTELVRATGCGQVHASARGSVADPGLAGNPALAAQMGGRLTTDPAVVRQLRSALDVQFLPGAGG